MLKYNCSTRMDFSMELINLTLSYFVSNHFFYTNVNIIVQLHFVIELFFTTFKLYIVLETEKIVENKFCIWLIFILFKKCIKT